MGLGGTLCAMERCMASWGEGPPSVDVVRRCINDRTVESLSLVDKLMG